jgi:hypothetical protein
VYCAPFELHSGSQRATFGSAEPQGSSGPWDTASASYGTLVGMGGMSDDPLRAAGSGADRLHKNDHGDRFVVMVKPVLMCEGNAAPGAVANVSLAPYPDELFAHERAELLFRAAGDDSGVFGYDVRVSTEPIVDESSFMRGQPAKNATLAAEELRLPTNVRQGEPIEANLGGLVAETHYYVGVRALDGCAAEGPIGVAEFTTPQRIFATVTPCFVATAAYGTPFAVEISALRRFRDRHLVNHAVGRALVAVYGRVGPKLAAFIRGRDALRAVSRALLAPAVAFARLFDD